MNPSPARATMLTGRWPHSAGVPSCNVPLDASVPTFAELLPDNYRTALVNFSDIGVPVRAI